MAYRGENKKIYIMILLPDRTYECLNNGKIYDNLDGFEDINEKVIEKQ